MCTETRDLMSECVHKRPAMRAPFSSEIRARHNVFRCFLFSLRSLLIALFTLRVAHIVMAAQKLSEETVKIFEKNRL